MRLGAQSGILAASVAVLVGATACGGNTGSSHASRSSRATTSVTSACPSSTVVVRDVPYGDDAQQRLDVYPAAHGCPAPVVMWVHGGGWQIGDKSNQMTDKVKLWNDAGYTVVSVNYRLTDPNAADPVRFPAFDEDVAAAVAWVHDHIDEHGGDPDRVALLGHSAGAQIAASVGTDPKYLAAHHLGLDALRCVGALDTAGYDVGSMASRGNALSPFYTAAFGDDPAVWADASPIEHVHSGEDVPRFLVVERGTARRRSAGQAFATRLREAGIPVTVVDAGSLTHAQVDSEVGRPGDTIVTPPLERFLAKCFASTP